MHLARDLMGGEIWLVLGQVGAISAGSWVEWTLKEERRARVLKLSFEEQEFKNILKIVYCNENKKYR